MTGVAPAAADRYDSLEEYGRAIDGLVVAVKREFLKLETLPSYDEGDSPAYQAFRNGDIETAARHAAADIARQRPLYESLKKRQATFARVRIAPEPPSAYLKFEIEPYKVASTWGEQIYVLRDRDLGDLRENPMLRDFLLFDDDAVCVHDFDAAGVIHGGWIVRERPEVNRWRAFWFQLHERSIHLGAYLEEIANDR